MTDAELKQAMAELQEVVRCRCDEAYRDRGLHDPQCECDSADAVKVVADHIKALTAKLEKAVAALERAKESIENGGGGGVVDVVWLDDPCPETLCDFIDATLAEIKGESHE